MKEGNGMKAESDAMKQTVRSRGWLPVCAVLGAALAGVGGCSSSSTPLASGQAGATGGATVTGAGGVTMTTGAGGGSSDAATDLAVGPGSPDANQTLPAGWLAESPPEVSCTGQVDAAVECELPASTCALASGCDADVATCMSGSKWIVYYENARCVAGRCVWDQAYFQCGSPSVCRFGACITVLGTA
jgi:hypothetical protein